MCIRDREIYYNPDGGQYYHSTANCSSVKDRFLPLTGFTYGELDTGSFAKLTPCPYCSPVQRKAEIDEENRAMGLTTPQSTSPVSYTHLAHSSGDTPSRLRPWRIISGLGLPR